MEHSQVNILQAVLIGAGGGAVGSLLAGFLYACAELRRIRREYGITRPSFWVDFWQTFGPRKR